MKDMEEFDEYGFPAIYPPDVLDEMHSRLRISDDAFRRIHQLFDAACNLYALISLEKLYELCQHFFPEISQDDFLDATQIIAHEPRNYYAIVGREVFHTELQPGGAMERELVAEHLYVVDDDYYEKMEQAQSGRPWYVPDWEEFVQFTDDFYAPDTPQRQRLTRYLQNTQEALRCPVTELVDDLYIGIRVNNSIQDNIYNAQRLGVCFQNQQEFREFLILLLKMAHHTRRYELRGHTPAELGLPVKTLEEALREAEYDPDYEDPLVEWGDTLYDRLNKPTTLSGKPARNAPCPCGSGRKYKNCCGK